MERHIQEFEPRINVLFSNGNYEVFDIKDYMSNIAMDYLEDLVEHTNTLAPQELIKTPKYHCFKRFLKDIDLFKPFIDIAKEYWDKSRENK